MLNYRVLNDRVLGFIFVLLFLSFFLQNYFFDIGFALKAFIILVPFVWLLVCKGKVASKYFLFECLWFLFILAFSFTGLLSFDIELSIRMVFGLLIFLVLYVLWVSILDTLSIERLIYYLKITGVLFNTLALVLYVAGLYKLNGNFGYQPETLGVLPDRGIPRLIGPLRDPNFFIAFNALFLVFFIIYNQTKLDKFGLIICSMTSLLTFSRGGAVALVIAFLFMSLFKKNGLSKMLFILMVMGVLAFVALNLFPETQGFIDKRLESASEGSGRFDIWSNAFSVFLEHPFKGIGIFSFLTYNETVFGDYHYMHNTYLEILVEGGIFVFLIYMGFLISLFMTTFFYSKNTHVQLIPPALIVISISFISLSGYANEYWIFFIGVARALLKNSGVQPVLGVK